MCDVPVLILSLTGLCYVTECWTCQSVVAEELRKINKKSKCKTWDFKSIYTEKKLQNQWFIRYGATPHTIDIFLDYLHQTFTKMLFQTDYLLVLSTGQNWLPNSPDLKIQKNIF